MKILVLGWYGHQNCGDESYKDTFCRLFPQHSLTFVDFLTSQTVDECEAIILGGGNVLKKEFLNQLRKVRNKKIYGYSVGIEEFPQEDISFFTHIYARDEFTLEVLQKSNISCSLMPDAAMILKGDEIAGKQWLKKNFDAEKCDLYSNIITVVVNSYMLNGSLNGLARDAFSFIKFSYDFARVIDDTSASFIFVPMGTQLPADDRTSNAWVAAKCKYWKKNYVVFNRLSHSEILNIIAASNLVISSRLHSSIFSFACGTPFIDITHHSKNNLFLKLTGKLDNSVSFWNFDSELLQQKIEAMRHLPKHNECEKFRSLIKEKSDAIRFD